MNGFDEWLQDEPQELQEVNEVGYCEAYDVMSDDKLTEDSSMEKLSKLLDEHKRISRMIEYDGCLMSEQRQLHANAETNDDKEAYFNSILRLREESDRNENKCDLIEQSIVKLFEEAANGKSFGSTKASQ